MQKTLSSPLGNAGGACAACWTRPLESFDHGVWDEMTVLKFVGRTAQATRRLGDRSGCCAVLRHDYVVADGGRSAPEASSLACMASTAPQSCLTFSLA